MQFSIYQASRRGARRFNQDRIAYCYSRDALLMLVAAGMGGHLHGAVAAPIALQFLPEAFRPEAKPALADPALFLRHAITGAHHAIIEHAAGGVFDDCVVGAGDRVAQKQGRIGQSGLSLGAEGLGKELQRDRRRHRPVQVSAHAGGNQHQQRIPAVAISDAVLVESARPAPALLVDGELHRSAYRPARQMASFRTIPRKSAAREDLDTTGSRSPISTFCSANTLCGRSRWSNRRHQSMVSSSWAEYLPPHSFPAETYLSLSRR